MSKIRINELARELEVKPNVIIDLLPVLGVGDKKTHSSSLDDDVALAIRQHLASEEGAPRERAPETEAAAHETPAQHVEESGRVAPTESRPQPVARVEIPPAETHKEAAVEEAAPVRTAPPLRPPLSTGSPAGPGVPHIGRGAAIPVKPSIPLPKPGQILSS